MKNKILKKYINIYNQDMRNLLLCESSNNIIRYGEYKLHPVIRPEFKKTFIYLESTKNALEKSLKHE